MEHFEQLAASIEKGDSANTKALVKHAIGENIPAQDILNNALIVGMNRIGIKFRNNEVFIPEVLVAARAMKAGLELLRPLLGEGSIDMKGKVAIGTVKGDLHDIGKNIVGVMLEGAGYEVVDLGTDVSKEAFLEAAQNTKAKIIGLSALLTTTMPYMNEIIDTLKEADLRDKIKVIIGGAPVTQTFADEIGADGYAPDAASAVDLVESLA
ncbi:MAG: corrinoid protein [Deltaproteobacteria bacterium]|nr:corrinoid protein [Deltaproteobacteria bacterium]